MSIVYRGPSREVAEESERWFKKSIELGTHFPFPNEVLYLKVDVVSSQYDVDEDQYIIGIIGSIYEENEHKGD